MREWRSDDKVSHSLEARVESKAAKELSVGEWFGVEPFDSVE